MTCFLYFNHVPLHPRTNHPTHSAKNLSVREVVVRSFGFSRRSFVWDSLWGCFEGAKSCLPILAPCSHLLAPKLARKDILCRIQQLPNIEGRLLQRLLVCPIQKGKCEGTLLFLATLNLLCCTHKPNCQMDDQQTSLRLEKQGSQTRQPSWWSILKRDPPKKTSSRFKETPSKDHE